MNGASRKPDAVDGFLSWYAGHRTEPTESVNNEHLLTGFDEDELDELDEVDELEVLAHQLMERITARVRRTAQTLAAKYTDRLLSTEETAAMLGVSKDWVREHGGRLGLRVRLPRNSKHLYPLRRVQKYIATGRKVSGGD